MHEIGIVRQILRIVTETAQENNLQDISKVVVDCGELSLVVPQYLQDLYPVVMKDTFLEESELAINVIPGMAECNECDEIFNVIEHEGYCPNCGSFDKEVLSGREFLVREIHVQGE